MLKILGGRPTISSTVLELIVRYIMVLVNRYTFSEKRLDIAASIQESILWYVVPIEINGVCICIYTVYLIEYRAM